MAGPRIEVAPPRGGPVLYGLESVADVVEDATRHWQAGGVEYFSPHCLAARVWGGACPSPAGEPSPPGLIGGTTQAELSGTFTPDDPGGEIQVDAREGDNPMQVRLSWVAQAVSGTWTTTIQIAASDPPRQTLVEFESDDGTCRTSAVDDGSGTTLIQLCVSGDGPAAGTLRMTDLATGASASWRVDQDVDGTVVPADVEMAYPAPNVPVGCATVLTTVTYDPAAQTVTATAVGGDVLVTLGSTRLRVDDDQSASVPASPGMWPIRVRHLDTGNVVEGTLAVVEGQAASLTLVLADCRVKDLSQDPWAYREADAFFVYAAVTCNAMGFPDASAAAAEALRGGFWRAVEQRYWDDLSVRAEPVVPGGADPRDVVDALGALEQYLAEVYNGAGLIHVSPFGLGRLAQAYLVRAAPVREPAAGQVVRPGLRRVENTILTTMRGTPVVVGPGYRPDLGGEVLGEGDFVMVATGQAAVRVAPEPEPVETFWPATNEKTAVAERAAAVYDDCPTPAAVWVSGASGGEAA